MSNPSPSDPDNQLLDGTVIAEFKRLTIETLTHDGSRGILAGIVGELVDTLELAAGFQIDSRQNITEGETSSDAGLALSPTQAAMCAGEFQRTAIFLRGLHDAITEAIEKKTSSPVHVLYAGSGPYATLAVPLMTVFPPDIVRFSILDIHPDSIEFVKSVVRRLELNNSVHEFIVADACEYTIPADSIPDIIVSETMSAALENEPQVAIMRYLVRQAPSATIVPESVRVDAFLVDTSKEVDVIVPEEEGKQSSAHPARLTIGPVFELNAETIHSWETLSGDRLPAAYIQIPPPPEPHYRPFLFTTITTFGKHRLLTHDSTLTGIREFSAPQDLAAGCSLQFHYRLGTSPCLVGEPAPGTT